MKDMIDKATNTLNAAISAVDNWLVSQHRVQKDPLHGTFGEQKYWKWPYRAWLGGVPADLRCAREILLESAPTPGDRICMVAISVAVIIVEAVLAHGPESSEDAQEHN